MIMISTAGIMDQHVRQKTAPFYFSNSYVKTLPIMTIFGTRIPQ